MPQIPLNENLVISITVVKKSKNYWESTNPVIQKKYGALCEEDQTVRLGDGTSRYSEIAPITYVGTAGLQTIIHIATEDNPGTVECISKDDDVLTGTGNGVVLARQAPMIMNHTKNMIELSKLSIYEVGTRLLTHWDAARPGYKVLTGSYIEVNDQCYLIMKEYLKIHPEEVITIKQYNDLSTVAGGIGGVHYYAFENDNKINGRIRLPDVRNEYTRAHGQDLPVVYVGTNQQFISENGMLFLQQTQNKHLGEIFSSTLSNPPGGLLLDGTLKNRETYSTLVNKLEQSKKFITDTAWSNLKALGQDVPYFSSGNGTTTFRLPYFNLDANPLYVLGPLYVQAYHAFIEPVAMDIELTLDEFKSELTSFKTAKVLNSFANKRPSVLTKNSLHTVPEYIVGSNKLQIYLNGAKCIEGSDFNTSTYMEVGTPGKPSTTVTWLHDIPVDYDINIVVL